MNASGLKDSGNAVGAACASLIREGTAEQVATEYARACRRRSEHEHAQWGSAAGMLNRFRLGLWLIDFAAVRSWLDAGCGAAGYFAEAEAQSHRFERLLGVDVTPAMVERAGRRRFESPVCIECGDIVDDPRRPERAGRFDLVTAIGLIQRCGHVPAEVFAALAEPLAPGGRLYLTTKHLGWRMLRRGCFEPDPGHSWFELDDLHRWCAAAGLHVDRTGGFLPREGRIVDPAESHTVFLVARRDDGAGTGARG